MKSNSSKKAALYTLGCRLNQSESHILTEQLEAHGYSIVPFGEPADLGIVNTCTVTHEADAKSRKAIRAFVRKNPKALVAVIGCYSQMASKTVAEIPGVDLVIGNQEKLNLLHYLPSEKAGAPLIIRDQIQRDDFTIKTVGIEPMTRRANLKIQDGCDFMCSFCIIPFARGRARSRELANLLEEARQLVDRGAKELVLTGVNIGTYRHEGRNIVDVVQRLNEIDGLDRIRISSIEPTTVPEELFDLMADVEHALVPYLHLPLQSGSNAVLERMRRLYTRDEYIDCVETARAMVPDLCVGADIMVGMPGETDEEFEETRSLLESGPIHYAHVFKYSDRDGAAASRSENKINPEVKNRRGAILRHISAEKQRRFHQSHEGRTLTVLFEHEEDGFWTGYTGNYIRVAARSNAILANTLHDVTLGESRGDFVLASLAEAATTV